MRVRVHQRLAAALFALSLLAGVAACGGSSDRDLIASAKGYLAKQDYKGAAIQLKAALQANPQSGEARFLLGDLLLKLGDPGAAVVELDKAHDLKYDDDDVLPALARALVAIGQPKKVTDLYGHAALTDPKAAGDLKATVATAFWALGNLERSEAATNAALQLDPKNVTARLLVARLTAGRGAIDDALKLVAAIIADDPKRREAWQLQGDLLWIGKNDAPGAIKAYTQAEAIDPRFLSAYEALIALLLRQHDLPGVRAQVAALRKALPKSPEARYYDTQLALVDDDLKRAREGAQWLLRVAPENVRVLQLAGAIELRAGALVVADSYLTKALQLAPELTQARQLSAEVSLRSGQPDKALSVLAPLLKSATPSAEALALAAEAELQNGNLGQAEVDFRRASQANPGDPKVRAALALTQVMKGEVEAGLAQLEAVAAGDQGTYADMALVSARLRRNDFTGALKDIDRLQAKLPKKALPYDMRGRVLARQKDAAGARASFEKALAVDPAYFPAIAGLADLDIADKHPELALKRFEGVLASDPRNYRALLAVAELRRRAGAPPADIRKLIADAVKASPTDAAPRLMLIEHDLSRRDLKSALAAAQDAVATLPDDASILDALGRAQMASGNAQQAISTFGKLAAAQPGSPMPQLHLAEAFLRVNDSDGAARSFRRALELSPDFVPAQQGLVRIALANKRYDDALAIARSAQHSRPNDAAGYLMEGESQAAQRHWDAAIGAFRSALDRSKVTEVAMRVHSVYVLAGRRPDADRFAAEWEKEHPTDALFQSHLGASAMSAKDYPLAELRYRKVIALRPDDAAALNNVAWLLVQQGKPGALVLAERANELAPDNPVIMDTLALALAADKQWPQALDWQRKAVDKASEAAQPGYRLGLARLLARSGDKAAARSQLEILAKLGDKFADQAEVTQLMKSL